MSTGARQYKYLNAASARAPIKSAHARHTKELLARTDHRYEWLEHFMRSTSVKKAAFSIALAAALMIQPALGENPAPPSENFTARKERVLAFLSSLRASGKMIAGTQVNEAEIFIRCDSMDRLVEAIGKEPALLGLELMSAIEYHGYEDLLVRHAVEHSRMGGLVTLTWHARNPLKVCTAGEGIDCARSAMNVAAFERMLTPGTREHALWLADVDAAATILKRLQNAGVIVFFRPYHEMNGRWFWWGEKKSYPQLWDALYERLELHHRLQNLVWVWAADRYAIDAKDYWPKKHPPSIVGTDVYEDSPDSGHFYEGAKRISKLAPKTLFAFTEVGQVPSRAVLDATRPVWVLVWGGEYLNSAWAPLGECKQCNSPDAIRRFFQQERMVMLADIPRAVKVALANGEPTPPSRRPHCPPTRLP
jgi:mannan endo-1,4-beta-mannosidase